MHTEFHFRFFDFFCFVFPLQIHKKSYVCRFCFCFWFFGFCFGFGLGFRFRFRFLVFRISSLGFGFGFNFVSIGLCFSLSFTFRFRLGLSLGFGIPSFKCWFLLRSLAGGLFLKFWIFYIFILTSIVAQKEQQKKQTEEKLLALEERVSKCSALEQQLQHKQSQVEKLRELILCPICVDR